MNFASFKSALGKAYETAASTAASAAKDLQSQANSILGFKVLFAMPLLPFFVGPSRSDGMLHME